jgi:hypothetical protein
VVVFSPGSLVRNTAAVARVSRLYVVYVWVTSSSFSVDHSAYERTRNFRLFGHLTDALPLFTAHNPHRGNELRLFNMVEAQTLAWHHMGAKRTS